VTGSSRRASLAAEAALALLLFALVAWATADGPTGFDITLLLGLRDPADPSLTSGPAWIGHALRGVTMLAASATLIPLGLVGAGLFAWRKHYPEAVFVVVAIGGGVAVNALLKALFVRARPDLVEHLVETHSTGFPSGHAFNSASACVTLCLLLPLVRSRRVRLAGTAGAIAFAALAGFSRLYFGVHWPSDVLAGWSAGTAWALLCAIAILRKPGPSTA